MIYDINVVGDGIIAYSIAYELSKRDPSLKIAMTSPSPKRELRSASLAAGAMINVYSELDVNTFESDISIQKLDMAIHSLEMWDEWASNIGVSLHTNYTLVKNYMNLMLLILISYNKSITGSTMSIMHLQ